jgi:hypothetical protein
MKHFTVYNETGEILRSGICQADMVEAQAAPGEHVIEAESDVEQDVIDPVLKKVVKGGKPPPPIDMDYRKARLEQYPPVNEQLDMLWHAMDTGVLPKIEPMYSRIKAVKAAYPKDNSVVPGSVVVYGVGP